MTVTNRSRRSGAGGPAPRADRPAKLRADAHRNRDAILLATVTALRQDPDASVAAIAAEAGVGRMTLYGHFKNRSELIDAALVESLELGDRVLTAVDLDGDVGAAFSRLIASSWTLVNDSRALLTAAQKELSPARIRATHEKAESRVRGLLEKGQREGVFRSDLPVSWLIATTHVVIHAAADEINAGRLDHDDAARTIDTTLRAAFANGVKARRSRSS